MPYDTPYAQDPNRYRGGTGGRFGPGMSNPSYGGTGPGTGTYLRPSGGRSTPNSASPAQGALNIGYGTGAGNGWVKPMAPTGKTHTPQGAHVNNTPGWLMKARRDAEAGTLPGIPDMRDIPGWEDWEGGSWGGVGNTGANVDTRAVVAATGAYLDERMGGEMADAARKFGGLGMLSSGGGLGGGYMGTLGESERGRDRDFAALQHQYDFQAAQADADRRMKAAELELRAFEDSERRRYGAWGAKQEHGWGGFDAGTDYDRYRYDQEMDQASINAANRNKLMMLYAR